MKHEVNNKSQAISKTFQFASVPVIPHKIDVIQNAMSKYFSLRFVRTTGIIPKCINEKNMGIIDIIIRQAPAAAE